MFDWSDEAVGELRRLFELGYAASGISDDMGGTFGRRPGRNAVIGKLHRLGLIRAKPQPPRPPRPGRKIVHRVANTWRSSKPMLPMPQPTAAAKPTSHGCTIFELTNETCRWPLGDGIPEFYCGAAAADMAMGRPYCPAHARVAYHPSSARRAA